MEIGGMDIDALLRLGRQSTYLIPHIRNVNRLKIMHTLVYFHPRSDDRSAITDNMIHGMTNCSDYVEMFHEFILKMAIDYRYADTDELYEFNEIVGTNCAETLVELGLRNSQEMSIDSFGLNPFTQLTKLQISNTQFVDDEFQRLPIHFPNLVSLELENINANRYAVQFERLEHLHIFSNDHRLLIGTIAPLWQSNTALHSFKIGMVYNFSTIELLNSMENHQSLEHLQVVSPMQINENEIKQLLRNHPALVELHLPHAKLSINKALYLLRHYELLRKFIYHQDSAFHKDELEPQLPPGWSINEDDVPHRLVYLMRS